LDKNNPHGDGCNIFEFWTHEQIEGVGVGYDIEPAFIWDERPPRGWLHRFVDEHCPYEDIHCQVRHVLKWMEKLQLEPRNFFIQFYMQRPLGRSGFLGRAVVGKRRRSLLIVEFCLFQGRFAMEVDPYCDDIIPHELMHIKDSLDGRSPTLFPFTFGESGEWIDLLRHLWIDGYLEALGFPHHRKEARLTELRQGMERAGKKITDSGLAEVADTWWGRPMTLREAVGIGIAMGFSLERGSLSRWYSNQLRAAGGGLGQADCTLLNKGSSD